MIVESKKSPVYMLGLVVLILVAIGFIYVRAKQRNTTGEQATTAVTPAENQQQGTLTTSDDASTAPGDQTITSGLTNGSGLSFSQYTITVPEGWKPDQVTDTAAPTDTLTITNGAYVIKIYQAATGGAVCLYPDSEPFDGPSETYSTHVESKLADGTVFYRSSNASSGATKSFTVCQRGLDNTFQTPTTFGHITITAPEPPNEEAVMPQIDKILNTLKKV